MENSETNNDIQLYNMEGLDFLSTIQNKSVNLVLTDPPYIISHDTGMNKHYDNIKNGECTKSEEEWNAYKEKKGITTDLKKDNYMKYGTIYGKKYAIQTNYGHWDKQFTINILEKFVKEFYNKLVNGGTCIIFFDLWKISILYDMMKKIGFKQLRMIEWIKTNPQPLNSKVNYLNLDLNN